MLGEARYDMQKKRMILVQMATQPKATIYSITLVAYNRKKLSKLETQNGRRRKSQSVAIFKKKSREQNNSQWKQLSVLSLLL